MKLWDFVHCAAQGRGHLAEGIPCQDVTYGLSRRGVQVVALADGAGSAAFAEQGAACVVHRVTRLVCQEFAELVSCEDGAAVKTKLLESLREALRAEAKALHCRFKDLASTLLVAAVKGQEFFLLHIGDGVIGYLKEGALRVASQPENGEFANTTTFVTSGEALGKMKLFRGELKDIEGFVLMSDGGQASLYNKRNNTLAGAVGQFFEFCKTCSRTQATGELRRVFEETITSYTRDDCSVGLLFLRPEELVPFVGRQKLRWRKKRWSRRGL